MNLLELFKNRKVYLTFEEADKFMLYFNDNELGLYFDAILKNKSKIKFDKERVRYFIAEKEKHDLFEYKLHKTAYLNNKGIALERDNKIQEAISTYEENLKIGNPARHSFDRLMILYRRNKDYHNEERVILNAIEVFKNHEHKYIERLEKCRKLISTTNARKNSTPSSN